MNIISVNKTPKCNIHFQALLVCLNSPYGEDHPNILNVCCTLQKAHVSMDPGVQSASNINVYQEYFQGVPVGRDENLTTFMC